MPARLEKKFYKKVLKLAELAHRVLGCKGLQDQTLNFSKINSVF